MSTVPELADVYRLETPEQALALLNPLRADIVRLLTEPASAAEVARRMGESPQKLNYHLKSLEKAGLIVRAGTRQVKNLIEVQYRARARTYVIPESFGWPDDMKRKMKDQGALRQLINVSERLRRDALRLMDGSDDGRDIPSAVLETELALPDESARQAFLRDYADAVKQLARKYGATGAGKQSGDGVFRAMLAVYPLTEQGGDGHE